MKEKVLNLDLKGLEIFAKELSTNIDVGTILCLIGDLGSGKTTFVRYLIKSIYKNKKLIPPISIKSPSFPILFTYNINDIEVYHYDLYRIKKSNELTELNIYEELVNSITLIEWPEIILDSLDKKKYYLIKFEIINENTRKITHNLSL